MTQERIPTSDWLAVSLFWAAVALSFFSPALAPTLLGKILRRLFRLILLAHVAEGLCTAYLAFRRGFSPIRWFLRGLYFGFFALRKLL